MAFNPFHGMRKHQNTVFTVLAIVCMLVFIFTGFGAGDLLSRGLGWFGGGRGKGQVVTTLNGTKVYESDLNKLTRLRELAGNLVYFVAMQSGEGEQTLGWALRRAYFQSFQIGLPPRRPLGN